MEDIRSLSSMPAFALERNKRTAEHTCELRMKDSLKQQNNLTFERKALKVPASLEG